MKKDTIVQFVGFITNLDPDAFAPKWEGYAQKLMNKKHELVLQQQVSDAKSKFKYLCRHEWKESDFHFSFMNEKLSEYFPENNVKVIQAGGYIPLQPAKINTGDDSCISLVAFISHNDNDVAFYRSLPFYRYLNIHQAYYESCLYGYVMEFYVDEKNAGELLMQLKQRPGVETGIYRECLVPQV